MKTKDSRHKDKVTIEGAMINLFKIMHLIIKYMK